MRILKLTIRCLALAGAFGFGIASATEEPASLSTDAIINLALQDTWALFTTSQGLDSMGYGDAQIELRIGGRMQATGADGTAIAAEIASFEPQRMLSLKSAEHWSVLYFQSLGDEMTGLRWVELAPPTQAQNLPALSQAHRTLFDELVRRYAPECAVCKQENAAGSK